jgi:hypothetical protein
VTDRDPSKHVSGNAENPTHDQTCRVVPDGGNYTFDFHYDLVRKDGREFAKIGKHDFSFSVKKATFDVEKTFGDSIIGTLQVRSRLVLILCCRQGDQ